MCALQCLVVENPVRRHMLPIIDLNQIQRIMSLLSASNERVKGRRRLIRYPKPTIERLLKNNY